MSKTETKYTPGPWEVGTVGHGAINHVYCDDVFGSSICEVPLAGSMLSIEQRKANLALIAAAPQMHEALKMVEWVEFSIGNQKTLICHVCENAKVNGHAPGCELAAALAKADGKAVR